jgi:ABC-type transport system substrate-binding protein
VFRVAGENTPVADVRVRQALNLAIDREAIVTLLGGMAVAAQGHVLPDSPWFGTPKFKVRYDPDAAKRLLAEAGYSSAKPLSLTVAISPSGSGQMHPLTMNELIQQQLKLIGVELKFKVMDWESLRVQRTKPVTDPTSREIHAVNTSLGVGDPYSAFSRLFASKLVPPAGLNWGGVSDPVIDALLAKAEVAFDPAEQDAILRPLHEHIVDQAYWLWVVHDVNPRAMAANVKGFKQAKSWYQDLTQVSVGP